MSNLSFLLLGITLAFVSIAAITYSASDLRNTSLKRHNFFKGIRMFMYIFLMPVFAAIFLMNLREVIMQDFVTFNNSSKPVIYMLSATVNLIITIVYIGKPVNKGIELFRRHNRDNTKYTKAISKSRMGLIIILLLTAVTIFINV